MKIYLRKHIIDYLFFLLFSIMIVNIFLIKEEKQKINISYNNTNKIRITTLNFIDTLKKNYQNDDIVGYLEINDMITTPIVQTNNNSYYLNHSLTKEKIVTGSIFADYRVDLINDKKILIYGHNSNKYDLPFGKLKKYLDNDFLNQNKYITLVTDKTNIYEIFSVFTTKNDFKYSNVYFNNDNDYLSHLNYLKDKSIFKSDYILDKDDYIITLQTCLNDELGSLLVVNGRKVNYEKKI